MPTPLEAALQTLLPTHNTLPSALTTYATSLLASSRAAAPTLKPDEEIGRTYACAHLAAERLKLKLGLEVGKPRPPVPPRVYKKLYGYLDQAVGSAQGTPRTPGGRKRDAVAEEGWGSGRGGGSARKDGEEGTPRSMRRKSAGTPTRTPTKTPMRMPVEVAKARGTTGSNVFAGTMGVDKEELAVPKWTMGMIWRICDAFGTPSAAAYVFAGANSVLGLRGYSDGAMQAGAGAAESRKRRRSSAASTESRPAKRLRTKTGEAAAESTSSTTADDKTITATRVPALLVVLYLYVLSHLVDQEISDTDFMIWRAQAIQAIRGLEEGRTQTDEDLMTDIDAFMHAARDEGWWEQEWFVKMPKGGLQVGENAVILGDNGEGVDGANAGAEDEEDQEDEGPMTPARKGHAKTPLRRKEKRGWKDDAWESAAGLKAGLGTMFQDAFDWLSDERRADYKNWEAEIRARIEQIERDGVAVHEGDVMAQ